jgi:hypothetical protein
VSDRLEAVLARTDELDAANVAHLAQSISEMRGKSHGIHGIHPGMLASDISPPGSSHKRSPTQQGMYICIPTDVDFVHFSSATLARTRKAKAYSEVRAAGMRLAQQNGKSWNLLQCLRDREVRRISGEELDIAILESRTRDSSKAGSVSSFGGTDSIGEGRTRGRKRHSSPIQPAQRGHIRQQSSRHHADRFRPSHQSGLENWSVTPEEFLANFGWQQLNQHRMINRRKELIHPPTEDERRSDGVSSITSSFEYDRKAMGRYSSDGAPLSPQVSMGTPLGISIGSPLARSTSAKAGIRNVPSFAMSSNSLTRSRSPSPVRDAKHTRQTSDLLELPQRVAKKLSHKIKGDRSGVSSRAPSPVRSETVPTTSAITEDGQIPKRSSTLPQPLRLDINILARRPTIMRRQNNPASLHQAESKRELLRTRARLTATGITTRAMLQNDTPNADLQPIASCFQLMGNINGLNKTLTTSFEQIYPKATAELITTLSNLEERQAEIAKEVQSSLTKTRTETTVSISDIASEQTSTILLQLKAVEDRMDALEYRTNTGWTHEKTLHLLFLVLEYIVMVVLWHLWVLLSVLRLGKQAIGGVWAIFWGIVTGIIHVIRWLFFLYP